MKRILLILVGLGGIVALIPYLVQLGEPRGRDYESETVWERRISTIVMLSSDEKQEWIQKAASDFGRLRPDINIQVKVMSSVDGMNAILSRQVTPTLWSPAESAMLTYLLHRWRQEFGVSLFKLDGEDAPQSLARSPVVWLSWRSRIDAITTALNRDSVWADIGCAGVPHDPVEWPAQLARWSDLIDPRLTETGVDARTISSWGDVKFFHTDPTRTNVGFHAIYLMTYQFLIADQAMKWPAPVTTNMLDDKKFLTWFRRCQRLRKDYPSSVRTLTRRPLQFGPKNYDIVVTYENLALGDVIAMHKNWPDEQPYIYYPPLTTWADHPVVILNSGALTPDQRDAARDWIAFLLAPDRQRSLISFGLRPIHPRISVRDQHVDNPFVKGPQFGVQIEPKFDSPPGLDGETIDHLLDMWRKATGYY
jgi:hypothetical protein